MSVTRGQCDARPTVTFPATLAGTKLYCLVTEARVLTTCPRLQSIAGKRDFEPATCWLHDAYIGGHSGNVLCMTISGGRTEQLVIFCCVTGLTSDFLSFIVGNIFGSFTEPFKCIIVWCTVSIRPEKWRMYTCRSPNYCGKNPCYTISALFCFLLQKPRCTAQR